MKLTSLVAVLCGLTLSMQSHALGERTDYDLDNNGLIEINDLADLNEIRNDLTGASLYGSSAGCPTTGCIGFELTTDLDFDTNGDGLMNAEDTYWNNGSGWGAIGSNSTPFSAVFEGNGYNIRNLYINSSYSYYSGLFGYLSNAQVTNIGLTGPLVYVRGYFYTGILAGRADNSHISAVHVSGRVLASSSSTYYLGGIVGHLDNSQLERSIASVQVSGAYYSGGLAGYASNSQLTSVMATGSVVGSDSYTGGLIGYSVNSSRITNGLSTGMVRGTSVVGGVSGYLGVGSSLANTYWATDFSQQSESGGTGGVGATFAQLACPTADDNTECISGITLYEGWGQSTNVQGELLWDFGIAGQLPGLRLNGVVYRDSDNDGVFDSEDAFPNNRAASTDIDGDGYPDRWNPECDQACRDTSGLTIDQFPNNPAAHLDADFDGFPDAWNPDCNSSCQSASGLELDLYPNDADNNGVIDSLDENRVDKDGNGLIEISTLAELNAIRFQLQGHGLQLSANDSINTIGCPTVVDKVGNPVRRCHGYELTQDLDFDTNGDGLMNAEDTYWNNGSGWVPIGNNSTPFLAIFEGNGYKIRNLYIDGSSSYRGLFGYLSNATVTNVGMTGPLVYIRGYDSIGILAGRALNSRISGVYASGRVLASSSNASYHGGIVGELSASQLDSSFAGVHVSGAYYSGGFVGHAFNSRLTSVMATGLVVGNNSSTGGIVGEMIGGQIAHGLSTVRVTGTSSVGGIVGDAPSSNALITSYWATDTSQQSNGNGNGNGSSGVGVTLNQLTCPTAADNSSCAQDVVLYEGWGELTNAQSEPLWDFGIAGQLPGLRLKGVVYRDSDNDGVFDSEDAFPNNRAASIDRDGDGAPDAWNASCDAECQANSGLVLDAFPLNAAAAIDTDGDGAPDAWNESCDADCQTNSGLVLDNLPLNAAASIDTDGDGVPDAWNESCDAECQANSGLVLDAFPLNAAASIDTDGDGAPDAWNESCDAECQTNSGLVLDNLPLNAAALIDTDGDGAPDAWNESCDAECQANSGLVLDAFPLNAAAAIDTDGDGAPDAWNESCDAECQANSGLVLDAFPLNAAASIDTDGDGAPDAWNESCDVTCQTNSGLVLDAFPLNAAASIDLDGDGRPDAWNASCNAECQLSSGLALDAYPNDADNDGVPDNIDPDNTRDNGIPLLQAVPEDLVLHATDTLTPVTLNTGALLAWDVVDSASELRFEVSLNGRTLTIDEQSNVSLPSGHHRLSWVAIDRAGNQSEPLTQSVVIYPTLGFAQEEVVTGEGSVVRIPLVFSGPSPMYPVVIRFQWEEALGDVSREDFDESVDLDDLQLTIADEDALAEAALLIALLEDNQDEANENLVLSIASVIAGDDSVALNIDENGANKTVVVTDENLAPTVSLIFEHQGVVQTFTSATMNEVEIDLYSGEFQLDAVVEDPNGRDTHRYTWNLGQLPHQLGEADTQLRLDPINLVEGDYELALQVTDSGVPNLTSNIVSVRLRIFDATRSSSTSSNSSASSDVSSASSSSSSKPVTKKKKSGGSSNGGLLLLLVLLGLPVALSKRRTA